MTEPRAEFLARLHVRWPSGGDEAERRRLMAAEEERRAELIEAGALRRLWRDPGHWANWTVWCVEDATELHALLTTLPLHPWMEVSVHPLARHHADPGWSAATNRGEA